MSRDPEEAPVAEGGSRGEDGSPQVRPPDGRLELLQRHHPVHMPLVERHNTPIILFVTLTIQPRGPYLANERFHRVFAAACGDANAWTVGLYLIMPDHVHLFCRPAREPRVAIKRWSTYLKERITKRLRADGSAQLRPPEYGSPQVRPPSTGSAQLRPPKTDVEGEPAVSRLPWTWQPDCWDTQMRTAEHYHEKWAYVRQNPVRKLLVRAADEWPYQGALSVLAW